MEVKLIGITGQSGSGKSFVGLIFKKQAIPVINIDNMLSDMFDPGSKIHGKLIEMIGSEILNNDGSIDMSKLTTIIKNEQWVANLIDWIVEDELDNTIGRIKTAFMYNDIEFGGLESTNLLNSKIKKHIFKIILVQCDDDVRMNRMITNGISFQVAKKITNKKTFINTNDIDYFINNSIGFAETEKQCLNIYNKLMMSKSVDC